MEIKHPSTEATHGLEKYGRSHVLQLTFCR